MTFVPGQSGNPGGRPKKDDPVKLAARKHSTAAIKKLALLVESEDGNIAVKACNAILDRAYGKPQQALDVDATVRTVVENWRERASNSTSE